MCKVISHNLNIQITTKRPPWPQTESDHIISRLTLILHKINHLRLITPTVWPPWSIHIARADWLSFRPTPFIKFYDLNTIRYVWSIGILIANWTVLVLRRVPTLPLCVRTHLHNSQSPSHLELVQTGYGVLALPHFPWGLPPAHTALWLAARTYLMLLGLEMVSPILPDLAELAQYVPMATALVEHWILALVLGHLPLSLGHNPPYVLRLLRVWCCGGVTSQILRLLQLIRVWKWFCSHCTGNARLLWMTCLRLTETHAENHTAKARSTYWCRAFAVSSTCVCRATGHMSIRRCACQYLHGMAPVCWGHHSRVSHTRTYPPCPEYI